MAQQGRAGPAARPGPAYRRLDPIEPVRPAVPADAFGALRLPFLAVPPVPPKKSLDRNP